MFTRIIAGLILFSVLAVLAFVWFPQQADAAAVLRSTPTAQSEDEDELEKPKRWQVAVGVGSIFVMIAVVKWL